jgi:hypothetical protein
MLLADDFLAVDNGKQVTHQEEKKACAASVLNYRILF